MVDVPGTLPDLDALDAEAMKAMIANQHALIEHLKLVILKLRRMQFGRRSEKTDRRIEQLQLQLEDLEASCAEHVQLPASEPALKPAPPAPRKSRSLPGHLRREVHTHLPEHKSCPECGGSLKKLGEDVSEMLEYIPASFLVPRHVRPKLSCARCSRVVQAPAPTRPVDRGLAGPGLLAHVLTAKFADHLPLYRQSQMYAREGVDLDRSTLAKWVGQSSSLLAPLVEALRRYVMSADKLHGDDTPLPVLAPGNGRTKTARFCMIIVIDHFHVMQALEKRISRICGEMAAASANADDSQDITTGNLFGEGSTSPGLPKSANPKQKKLTSKLKKYRRVFMKKAENRNERDRNLIRVWAASFPLLEKVLNWRDAFYRIWASATSSMDAQENFNTWKRSLSEESAQTSDQVDQDSGQLAVMYAPFVDMVEEWGKEIFAFFDFPERPTNAFTEAMVREVKSWNNMGRHVSFPVLRARFVYYNPKTRRYKQASSPGPTAATNCAAEHRAADSGIV